MISRFFTLALLVASILLHAPARAQDVIEFEFWHAMGGRAGGAVNDIADRFNKSQDKYRVTTIYQGRYDSLSQKLIASLYARRNPAASQMYPGWTTRFLKYGYLQPVEDFVKNDPDFGEDDLNDFFPVMIAENTMPDPKTGEKKLTTLPFNKSVYVLYVNQSKMNELGWEDPPKTWDEFRDLAAAMTEMPEGAAQPEVYGFASRPYIEDFTVQAFAAGTQLFDEENNEILIDSEPAMEAMRFLRSLTTGSGGQAVGYIDSNYLSGPFGSGRIGMFIASTASMPYNDMAVGNKFIWNAYRVPSRNEETEGMTLMQGTNVGIFGNRPEDEKRAAWELLKFMTSTETMAEFANSTGYMPVRRSAKLVSPLKERLETEERYANAVETLEHAAFEPRRMFWESVRSTVSREVEAILLGRDTVDEGLETAHDDIEQIIESAD